MGKDWSPSLAYILKYFYFIHPLNLLQKNTPNPGTFSEIYKATGSIPAFNSKY
jgi:hypothetical protein